MDKSWMQLGRSDPKYISGILGFIDFVIENANGAQLFRCPCRKCKCSSSMRVTMDQMYSHLSKEGIWILYTTWSYHGEAPSNFRPAYPGHVSNDDAGPSHTIVQPVMNPHMNLIHDMFPQALANEPDLVDHNTNETDPVFSCYDDTYEVDKFNRLVADAQTPLYPGCEITLLTAVLSHMKVKVANKLTNKAVSDNLKLCGSCLPEGHCLPDSYYKLRKILNTIGLGYEKIHACRYDCALFYKENAELDYCPVCSSSRWKRTTTPTRVPVKVLRYFPLTPRLKRLYMSSHTAADMTWHSQRIYDSDTLIHPADGESWKSFDVLYPEFAAEIRNVRLGLSTDGFNPFGNMSLSHSTWPVIVVPYNLPPWLCMKKEFNMLTLLIPGPKSPGNCLDVYMRPLVDELQTLWAVGSPTYDSQTKTIFRMRAALLWTISDFPGYGMLSSHTVSGFKACPLCLDDVDSEWHAGKCVILCYRRWLAEGHGMRFDEVGFLTKGQEHRLKPVMWSGDQIVEKLNEFDFGVLSKHPAIVNSNPKRPDAYKNWSHKSIFFELPYWTKHSIRHCLDVMHIEKNVAECVIGTVLDLEGKTKDSPRSRKNLQANGIRPHLWLRQRGSNLVMPQAPYTVTKESKTVIFDWLRHVKFPHGYAGNISRCVKVGANKISGLKSHDLHVMLQRLFPVVIRPFLIPRVVDPLVALSRFFQKLCARELKKTDIEDLKQDIVYILCNFEKIFPPSFFVTQVHVMIHLPDQVLLTGPVHYTWMFPMERQLGAYKGFVANRSSPEGCIAEAYIAHEAVTYCNLYLGEHTNNDDASMGEPTKFNISVWSEHVRTTGSLPKSFKLSKQDLEDAHWCVLQYCTEAQYYQNRHLHGVLHGQEEKSRFEFPNYLRHWMLHYENKNDGYWSSELNLLSMKPLRHRMHSICFVNGVKFVCEHRDQTLKTQNSGVMITIDGGSPMYGVLVAVVDLVYPNGMEIVLFKCNWFDTNPNVRGSTKTDRGLLSVNTNSRWYEDDPFILATMAKQVFYLDDPKQGDGWKVVNFMSHRNIYTSTTLAASTGQENEEVVQEAYQEDDTSTIPTLDSIRFINVDHGELQQPTGPEIDLGTISNIVEDEDDDAASCSESNSSEAEADDSEDEDYHN